MSTVPAEGELLWEPSETFKSASRMADYMRWLEARQGRSFDTYDDLWHWSVADLEAFWSSIVEFFGVQLARPALHVLGAKRSMPGAVWFEGAELNYAENVFRHAADDAPALLFESEARPLTALPWSQLEAQVASVAAGLREMGVGRGDRVVAYMPNIPETVVAFLAAASLGAIWSSCSPDFGVDAVLDRFSQIEPRVLFAVDSYSYGGKLFPRLDTLLELQQGLPTLTHTVVVERSERSEAGESSPGVSWADLLAAHPDQQLTFEPVPFDHPLWVLYSSGTTGLPKALVHSHGGVVLEHVKLLGLHCDLREGDRLFWYTSTGWMMWNFIVGGLLVGATPVLFDGNPAYPEVHEIRGQSASRYYDLSALQCIGSTGSPLPPEGFGWALVPNSFNRADSARRRERRRVRRAGPIPAERNRRAGHHPADALDAGLLVERRRRAQPLSRQLLRHVSRRLAPRRLDQDHFAWQRGHPGTVRLDAEPSGRAGWHKRGLQRD